MKTLLSKTGRRTIASGIFLLTLAAQAFAFNNGYEAGRYCDARNTLLSEHRECCEDTCAGMHGSSGASYLLCKSKCMECHNNPSCGM